MRRGPGGGGAKLADPAPDAPDCRARAHPTFPKVDIRSLKVLCALQGEARTDSECRAPTRSLGLGLYIVRSIVQAHGGDVTVTSDDTGTYFRVDNTRWCLDWCYSLCSGGA